MLYTGQVRQGACLTYLEKNAEITQRLSLRCFQGLSYEESHNMGLYVHIQNCPLNCVNPLHLQWKCFKHIDPQQLRRKSPAQVGCKQEIPNITKEQVYKISKEVNLDNLDENDFYQKLAENYNIAVESIQLIRSGQYWISMPQAKHKMVKQKDESKKSMNPKDESVFLEYEKYLESRSVAAENGHRLFLHEGIQDKYVLVHVDIEGHGEACHRLALRSKERLTFSEAQAKGQCRHSVGCPRNCIEISHLSWGDAQDQARDNILQGRTRSGERIKNAILWNSDVLEIVQSNPVKGAKNQAYQALANKFNVTKGHVKSIRAGYAWNSITGKSKPSAVAHKLTTYECYKKIINDPTYKAVIYKRLMDHKAKCEIKPNGCWIQKGRADTNGYGMFIFQRTCFKTHCLSYVIHNNVELGVSDQIRHSERCASLAKFEGRRCWNPEHLTIGTVKENARDRYRDETIGTITLDIANQIRLSKTEHPHLDVKDRAEMFGVTVAIVKPIDDNRNWLPEGMEKPLKHTHQIRSKAISQEKAKEVIASFSEPLTHKQRAERFGITQTAAFNLFAGRTYPTLPRPPEMKLLPGKDIRLTDDAVKNIFEERSLGKTQSQIGIDCGVKRSTIGDVLHRRIYKHVIIEQSIEDHIKQMSDKGKLYYNSYLLKHNHSSSVPAFIRNIGRGDKHL